MSTHMMDELRKRYPGVGRAADHENSRTSAITLKCLDCCSGQREGVRACPSFKCALWPYRPYQDDRERPVGAVPTQEGYAAIVVESGRAGSGDALAKWRAAQDANPEDGGEP